MFPKIWSTEQVLKPVQVQHQWKLTEKRKVGFFFPSSMADVALWLGPYQKKEKGAKGKERKEQRTFLWK